MKIFKTKSRKNKEKNIIVLGEKSTGMNRAYINVPPIKGEDLINSLLINGKYAGYDDVFSDEDIYIALQKCKNLVYEPCCDSDIPCDDMLPLSARQAFCSGSAIRLIMKNEYNLALHEFEDCIDDYGKGKSRYITKNEMILYNCILTCFIARLEKQADK